MNTCIVCDNPKTDTKCEICSDPLCKKCRVTTTPELFEYSEHYKKKYPYYTLCPDCEESTLAPALERYQEIRTAAKAVYYWPPKYRRALPILKKAQKEFVVDGAKDRDDALAKISFMAAENGYNALINCEIEGTRKALEGKYKTTIWAARALGAIVDAEKIERENQYNW